MTLLEKAGIAVIALLIAAGAGGLLVYRHNLAAVAALEQRAQRAEDSLKSTNAALAAKTQALKDLDRKYAAKNKALNDALKANPDWADAPVPDAVFGGVFGPDKGPAAR